MKKETYILFTSGRGPLECGLAVQGIQKRFKNYLDKHKVPYEIVNQKTGDIPRSIETIVFKLQAVDKINLKPWLGTHLWHCKSPIRKFHKRKNWYIKCQELVRPQEVALTLSNVVVNTFRASGPGGQHRNKVETAVRIIHNPTGIIVTASDGKSQAQNKKKAWHKLEQKLKNRNTDILKEFDMDQWSNQILIERGNAIKTFTGLKFIES